jgi:hypothetical protein
MLLSFKGHCNSPVKLAVLRQDKVQASKAEQPRLPLSLQMHKGMHKFVLRLACKSKQAKGVSQSSNSNKLGIRTLCLYFIVWVYTWTAATVNKKRDHREIYAAVK